MGRGCESREGIAAGSRGTPDRDRASAATVNTHAGFGPDGFVPSEGLPAAIDVMLDQLIPWTRALRSVRAEKLAIAI
jgi:hypothetical protein